VDTLFQNTINCVRGVAAEAIGQLLWEHLDLYEKLTSGIEALGADPHPVVRMASLDALIPVLNINGDQAVDWFCKASWEDPRIPASYRGIEFFNYTIQKYAEKLAPIIRMMAYSSYPDVSSQGAQAILAYHMFYRLLDNELQTCINGTMPQRKGVVEAAANLVSNEKYAQECREILKGFFDDPEPEVREATWKMFNEEFFGLSDNALFTLQFIRSQAFFGEVFWLFHSLEERKESLIPFAEIILEICNAFSIMSPSDNRRNGFESSEVLRYCYGYMSRHRKECRKSHVGVWIAWIYFLKNKLVIPGH
jgi:hypothetical protein